MIKVVFHCSQMQQKQKTREIVQNDGTRLQCSASFPLEVGFCRGRVLSQCGFVVVGFCLDPRAAYSSHFAFQLNEQHRHQRHGCPLKELEEHSRGRIHPTQNTVGDPVPGAQGGGQSTIQDLSPVSIYLDIFDQHRSNGMTVQHNRVQNLYQFGPSHMVTVLKIFVLVSYPVDPEKTCRKPDHYVWSSFVCVETEQTKRIV